MKQKLIKIISLLTLVFLGSWGTSFAATIILTNTTDTLDTFRTNYNTTVTNLNNGLGGTQKVSTSTSETANNIPFWTTTSATPALLSGGSSNLTWDGTKFSTTYASTTALSSSGYAYFATSGGFVGIGTTSPSFLLSVGGAAGSTNGNALFSGNVIANNFYDSSLSGSLCVGETAGLLGTANCVTNVTASGNIASSGGSTPNITFTGILPYANGGTNGTGFTSNQLVFANSTSLVSASSTAVTPLGLYLGLGTTTPRWLLQLATSTQPQLSLSDGNVANSHWTFRSVGGNFYLGTSSPTTLATSSPSAFTISNNGQVSATEANIATSTNITVDWNTTPNQVLLRIGASATTIAFNNASTSGMTKRIVVCNPGQTAGAITWNAPVEWAGAVAPVQTTTSNQCDVYSFIVSYATSTTKVFGAGSTGFN